jgi:hypothetical protein
VNDGLFHRHTETLTLDRAVPGRVYVGTAGSSVFFRDFPTCAPPANDGDPCDDGDPCTIDACTGGQCQGTTPPCGDGTIAGCEACDDGAANGTPGSCCSSACTPMPAGTGCADDADPCTRDRCTAGGICAHLEGPDPLCVVPTSRGARLKLLDRPGTGVDRVKFKWARGPAITAADFGTPNGGTTYTLCVWDHTASGTIVAYRGRALPPCTTSPCWKLLTSGWKLKSPGGPDGITDVVLRSGLTGKAKLQVKAKGAPLSLPALPLARSPSVVAEVRTSDGACWGAVFSTAAKNDGRQFSAKSD